MAGLSLSGLASGLDTESIISSLMAVEGQGRTRLTLKQTQIAARQTDLQAVQTKLQAVNTAAAGLKSVATWLDTQTVETSDTAVTATRTGGAGPGGYDVAVTQLAAAERRTYGFTSSSSPTTLTVKEPGGTTRATVSLAAGATLDDAVSAINSSDDAGVYAANVDGRLVLSSKTTGSTGGFTLAGAGAQTDVVAGVDAQGTVSGKAFTSASNTLKGVIPGLEIALKAKTAGTGITVGAPQPDTDTVKSQVKAFVDAYNGAVDTIRTNLSEKRVPTATSATDASKGQLFADTGVSSMLSQLRQSLTDTLSSLPGGITSLAQLGISTGDATASSSDDAKAGKLTFNAETFDAALADNPKGVQQFLTGTGTVQGFGAKMVALLDPMSGTDGVLANRITGAGSEISSVKDSIDRFDARLDLRETYLRQQFTALETAISKSQSLRSSLASYLSS